MKLHTLLFRNVLFNDTLSRWDNTAPPIMTEQEWNVGGMILIGDISSALSITNARWTGLRKKPRLCEEKPAALRLSHPRILCLGVRQRWVSTLCSDRFTTRRTAPGTHTAYEVGGDVDGVAIKFDCPVVCDNLTGWPVHSRAINLCCCTSVVS